MCTCSQQLFQVLSHKSPLILNLKTSVCFNIGMAAWQIKGFDSFSRWILGVSEICNSATLAVIKYLRQHCLGSSQMGLLVLFFGVTAPSKGDDKYYYELELD